MVATDRVVAAWRPCCVVLVASGGNCAKLDESIVQGVSGTCPLESAPSRGGSGTRQIFGCLGPHEFVPKLDRDRFSHCSQSIRVTDVHTTPLRQM